MVFFTCSNCNETLKKNKVDQHCQGKCRRAEYVSCVDCGTDFYGNDYAQHTSCISEAQKYGGKDYNEKENANKGQKKQDLWLEKVQNVLDNTKCDDPRMKDILESLPSYPNIPQKKGKFINFLKNTFSKYRNDHGLMEKIWNILEGAKSEQGSAGAAAAPETKTDTSSVPADKLNGDDSSHKKKKKKARKASGGDEEEEVKPEEAAAATTTTKDKKKKKKKRRGDPEEEEEVLDEAEVAAMREKKWRKRDPEMDNVERLNDTLQEVEKQPKDFNISRLITDILDRKGTISLKNLRKKALAEFWECGISNMTEDKVLAKLDKKLRSMDNVKVINDKVYLADDED